MPLVSICIPTYNIGKFLRDSRDSTVAQTCEQLEILVLDHASEDDTDAIVAEFSARDARLLNSVPRDNASNRGLSSTHRLRTSAHCGESPQTRI